MNKSCIVKNLNEKFDNENVWNTWAVDVVQCPQYWWNLYIIQYYNCTKDQSGGFEFSKKDSKKLC